MKKIKGLRGLSRCRQTLQTAMTGDILSMCPFVLALVLMGCSSDDEPSQKITVSIELTSCMTDYQEAGTMPEPQQSPTAQWPRQSQGFTTRAWLPPTGFTRYDGTDLVIDFCLTQNGETPKTGYFYYGSGWRTTIDEIVADTYYLYGYTPHASGSSFEISSSSTPGDNSSYSSGAVLTIKNMPTASSSDVSVVVGAKNGRQDNGYTDTGDYSINGLVPGDFTYVAQPITKGYTGNDNKVFLLFDHLYAALRINMNVDGDYAALRTIKVKKMEIGTSGNGQDTKSTTDIVITLQANDTGSNPIQSIVYTPTGESTESNIIYYSPGGEALPTGLEYKTFDGYFMPENIDKIILTTTYDVYDRKGNLIREGCKADNTIPVGTFYLQNSFNRGSRYILTMTVIPTYLYMLSEPDLDNPTVVVN